MVGKVLEKRDTLYLCIYANKSNFNASKHSIQDLREINRG